ncbi:hypothetical protein FJZ28_04175 [Candidatus Peregrinibacteria bacterium]|nr:hypothetical protein [Candidatus Peregrinibacteria bacterium]
MFRRLSIIGFALLCGCSSIPDKDALALRYGKYTDMLQSETRLKGPRAGADLLRTLIDNDPAIVDLCHGLSHEIGQSAYHTIGFEQAMAAEDDVCGSGYIHGVIETHLAKVPDLEVALFSLCAPDAAKCFHGLGHGLMDRSGNDLPGSLAQCSRFERNHQKNQCAEGVFMENFDTNGEEHFSEYLKPDDIYFPCRGQTAVFEGVCALYAPRYYLRLHPGDYAGAYDWCMTEVPEGPRDACIKGFGSVSMKQHIRNPVLVEQMCDALPPEYAGFCIEGLVSYYVVHYASVTKGRELCAMLNQASVPICERIVAESEGFYEK